MSKCQLVGIPTTTSYLPGSISLLGIKADGTFSRRRPGQLGPGGKVPGGWRDQGYWLQEIDPMRPDPTTRLEGGTQHIHEFIGFRVRRIRHGVREVAQ